MHSLSKKLGPILRGVCLIIWVLALVTGVVAYILNPAAFSAENIAAFLSRFQQTIWAVYLSLSILRGFTLLPSTPLVFAGIILFPGQQFAVLAVAMIGILISSTMIYYFSELLGFDEYFERNKPETIHKIKAKLEHPLGVVFVAAWAFFPFVPTDLVCYLAGTARMNFLKFILAVFIGELILCCFYIFFAGKALEYVR